MQESEPHLGLNIQRELSLMDDIRGRCMNASDATESARSHTVLTIHAQGDLPTADGACEGTLQMLEGPVGHGHEVRRHLQVGHGQDIVRSRVSMNEDCVPGASSRSE